MKIANPLFQAHLLRSKYLMFQMLTFFVCLYRRAVHDRLTVSAGYLAYVTLLSLVPFIAVMFAMLSAFPVFRQLKSSLEDFIFSHFVPAAGEVVKSHVLEFVSNVNQMTAVGIMALVVVALLLISSVDKTLNYIWRARVSRRWTVSFSVYWMILTLGPILVGASLALSSYLLSLQFFSDPQSSQFFTGLLKLLPFVLLVLAFLMLYMIVPNARVRFKHAFVGAVVAALLFELSKKGFVLYISGFQSYQAIYGALAAIPILFLWVYLCWLVVLFGAELIAALGEYEWGKGLEQQKMIVEMDLLNHYSPVPIEKEFATRDKRS